MGTRWLAVLIMIAAASCGKKSETDTSSTEAAVSADAAAPAPVAKLEVAPPNGPKPVNVALPQIAYTYDYAIELPAKAVVPMFERHRHACEEAGPARCQIVGAATETVGGTDTSATLTLRADAGWLSVFRNRLSGEATAAEGRVASSKTESEDLGREISDTGARLRALTTLQVRLEALLATRSGKLADLLETERELARVGGEIDATRSALADMRGRVTLPKATIQYQPDSLSVAGAGRGAELGGQLYDVAATSLFALLNLVAAILPWLLIIVPLILLIRWARRRGREP